MLKEIYLAGKEGGGEDTLSHLANQLEERGHTITLKWWEIPKLPKPFFDNIGTSNPAAEAMIYAVNKADIFILIPSEKVMGALVELGIAIRDRKDHPEKEIIVVVNAATRQSVFYTSNGILILDSVERIQERSWY